MINLSRDNSPIDVPLPQGVTLTANMYSRNSVKYTLTGISFDNQRFLVILLNLTTFHFAPETNAPSLESPDMDFLESGKNLCLVSSWGLPHPPN